MKNLEAHPFFSQTDEKALYDKRQRGRDDTMRFCGLCVFIAWGVGGLEVVRWSPQGKREGGKEVRKKYIEKRIDREFCTP